MKTCPSCGAVAYDPVEQECEECFWSPEDEEDEESVEGTDDDD